MSLENTFQKTDNEIFRKTRDAEIVAPTIEEHEHLLRDRILEIQFDFLKKVRDGEISLPATGPTIDIHNTEECMSELTSILQAINEIYFEHTHRPTNPNNHEYEHVKKFVFNHIKNEYDEKLARHESLSAARVFEIINSHVQLLSQSQESTHTETGDARKKNVEGLLNFDCDQLRFSHYKIPESVLEKYDVDENDDCLQVHLDGLFKQKSKNQNVQNIFSSESFKKLASRIVSDYPHIRFILGRSWLLNTPVAERVGFHVYHENDKPFGGGVWGQLVNEKGQIIKERVDFLMKNGHLPYAVSEGYIPVEDFLRKYLPDDQKKNVVLKKTSKDALWHIKNDKKNEALVVERWNSLSGEEVVAKLGELMIFNEFFKTDDGKMMRELIVSSRSRNESFDEFKKTFKNAPCHLSLESLKEKIEKRLFVEYHPDLSKNPQIA